jgi:spore germination protein
LVAEWDDEAMSPYLVYKEDGAIKQIYYENLASLSLKYQLVRQLNLSGVAFWAIGYEGEFQEVWQEAGKKLKNL